MSIESITCEAVEHHRKGDYESALQLHKKALELLEATVGKSHLDTADRYRKMGSVMDDAGKFDKAKGYFEEAIAILGNVGTDPAKLSQGEICSIVGNMLYKKEDYKGASKKFSEAKEIIQGTPGADQSKLDEIDYLIEVAAMMVDD